MSSQTCLLDCLTQNICLHTKFGFLSALVPRIWAFRNFKNLSGGHFEKTIKSTFLIAGMIGAFFWGGVGGWGGVGWGVGVSGAKWTTKTLHSVCLQFCPG